MAGSLLSERFLRSDAVVAKPHRPILLAVVQSLRSVFEDGYYADKVIEYQFKHNRQWGSRDRKFIAEAVYETVRWWRLVWFCLDEDPELDEASLWRFLGAWMILQNHAYTEAVLSWPEVSMLNPAQIRARRDLAQTLPAVRESVPEWLFARGLREMGAEWETALKHLNQPAPAFLRANSLLTSREELVHILRKEEIPTEEVASLPDALKLLERKNIFSTKAFHNGLFEIQDGASQQIAPMLKIEPGLRVVDACAGAGGKSLHIAALMRNKGKLISMDIEEKKLVELRRRSTRAKVDIIETKVIESNKTIKRMEQSFDRVLLDVPCSGSGVIRRNPDSKWKSSEARLDELTVIQADILRVYAQMTKPGGFLVYATCSILPSENQDQVQAFLKDAGPDWTLQEERKFSAGAQGFDGFYAARLAFKAK
jgi:16S rRNA (cytosine967-C5)-methyltransferase